MSERERPVIVVPGDDPPHMVGSPHLERLKPYGEVVLYRDRPADDEEKVRRANEATAIINSRSQVTWPGRVLQRLPRLKVIAVCGIGTDAIDLEAARRLGIAVCNQPGRTAKIVAEHMLALLLGAARRVAYLTSELRAGRWARRDGIYLGGKTLGVVGAGAIGSRLIELARAIGMEVIAWTRRPTPNREVELGIEFVPLDSLLARCDAVAICVPLTGETRGMIGRREIGLMKPGSLLVNAARGPVVDTAALVEALESGHLAGAGLDVFDQEPLPADHPILRCEQVVLTPHCADTTPEGVDLLNGGAVDNVIAFFEGQPQNVVT